MQLKNFQYNTVVLCRCSIFHHSRTYLPVLPVCIQGPTQEMMMSDPHRWKPTTEHFLFACRAGTRYCKYSSLSQEIPRLKIKTFITTGGHGNHIFFQFFVEIRGRVWVQALGIALLPQDRYARPYNDRLLPGRTQGPTEQVRLVFLQRQYLVQYQVAAPLHASSVCV